MSYSVFADGTGDALREAYEDVRSDSTESTWFVAKYEGKTIVVAGSGVDYEEFLALLLDDERAYAYIRFETGDEMSRRAKFVFVTWIGPNVPPLKKAKVSTDKAFVKQICSLFGKEILADEKSDLKYAKLLQVLEKASGAAYGTGRK